MAAAHLASGYIDLSVHFADAMKQIRRAMDDVDAEIDVDANTAGATADMGRWRAKEKANPVNVRVDVDTKLASNQIRGLRRDLESLGRSDFLKINLGVAGIAGLPAVATGIAEVAASLQQLSQAALAVPGGIAGVLSSVGTLAFGLTGVADAYEALNKASDEQARSGRDAANQARAQQSASFGLRNAIVDQTQAREDLNRAVRDQRRELQDLALEQRGGVLSEQRAVLEAQKARERLYSGDFSDYREALLDIQEADLRIEEVRARNIRTTEDLNEANAKGINGSDRVVAANERLIRSNQGVAAAQGAVAAAAESTSAAQADADLALGKLSQNGQDFVNALMDVQGPVTSLRNLVQDKIFDGLDDELRTLTAKSMPTFERGLGGIGDAWNDTFTEMMRVAGLDDTQGILERIFGNTADAQNILNDAIDPLTEGVLTLTEAGTDALPRLADGFVDVSERFAKFITAADEDGRLDKWINEGITAFGHLGETMLNIGKIFTGITNATSGSFLANLETWTGKWATWVNSVEGQTALKDFFAEGKRVWEEWRPILEDLPGIFTRIYDAASAFSTAVSKILSPITEVLEKFPGLVEGAFLVFTGAKVVGAISSVTSLLTGMSNMLKIDLPASATAGATGIQAALGRVVVPAWLAYLVGQQNPAYNQPNDPKSLQAQMDAFTGKFGPGTLGGPANASRERRGLPPQLPGDRLPGANGLQVVPSLITGNMPKFEGGSARQFAHEKMMPFWQSQGLEVGDHAADWAGEHQNGALDIMVSSIEEGNRILQQALSDPNVYGAIFNNKTYGYGHGLTPQDYSLGNTGNPTTDHQDHVHIWYKPGGDNNIAPILVPPPVAPGAPAAPAAPGAPAGPGIPGIFPPPPSSGPTPQNFFDLFGLRPFDTGGVWPNGVMGVNTTGEDELVLSPDHLDNLRKQGIDPNSLMHGTTGGAQPGPSPEVLQQLTGMAGNPADQLGQAFSGVRTGGYIPAAAGNTSVAGNSFLSGLYGMGAEVINGFIDQAASAASSAAGMAASAFAPGSGGAASGLASAAIGMGTQAIKRGVDYGAQMLGIFTDSIIEQATPFGAPRILTTDPTGFMPQNLLGGALPGMLGQLTPQSPSAGPQPAPGVPNGTPAEHQGSGAAPGAPAGPPPGVGAALGKAQPEQNTSQTLDFLKPLGIYDDGGWLPPGGLAMNLTKKAEPMPVFNTEQWSNISSIANTPVAEPTPSSGGGGDYRTVFEAGSIIVKDVNELERKLEDRRRLNTMRYRGRP
ncbi:hypothetical protein [Mycolicibacterium neoaurum]|uniref:hypothetical protein n=1 Tax=Mycolicibacterium neoaurum TaxID=1795 RepID=UPI001F4D320C|nr:hypothetical protein [Mycolicibacterium neoaurum]